jgi:putative CocE/NonD family hydrolase
MSEHSALPNRPSWRQRLADRVVARAMKVDGRQPYTQLATSVPMSDGAVLLADVYLPENAKATVLIRSPYGRGFPLALLHARAFARHGYQVVVQSVRGRTGSTGEFRPVVNEAADGRDTVAWLAEQEWYSGRLATFGGSYLGLVQWALLSDAPDGYEAAVVVVGPHDFSRAVWRNGAFTLVDTLGWTQAMAGPEEQGVLRQAAGMRRLHRRTAEVVGQIPVRPAIESALAGSGPWLPDWLDHQSSDDAYWDAYRFTDALKNSDVPTLLIGGRRDAFLDQTLEQYDALRDRGVDVALTVGPWTHMETATKAAGHLTREALEWLDHHFVDGPARTSRVRAFVTGIDEWRDTEDLDDTGAPLELHLTADQLVANGDDGGATTFVYDPTHPTPAIGGRVLEPRLAGAKDNRPLATRGDVAVFTGERLTKPLELRGTPELTVRLTAANPHADLFVRLCDVDAKGRSVNVADAFVRLDATIPAGQEQVLTLTLDPCWHVWQAGHRLQLLMAGGAYPRYARNTGTADPMVASTLEAQPRTVHHDGTTLRLPVVEPG